MCTFHLECSLTNLSSTLTDAGRRRGLNAQPAARGSTGESGGDKDHVMCGALSKVLTLRINHHIRPLPVNTILKGLLPKSPVSAASLKTYKPIVFLRVSGRVKSITRVFLLVTISGR